jgi:hypothetical protein
VAALAIAIASTSAAVPGARRIQRGAASRAAPRAGARRRQSARNSPTHLKFIVIASPRFPEEVACTLF